MATVEKAWFYERFFFEVVIVMVKDTMSIKISFIHCMKGTKVMLPIVFEEFEMVYNFLLLFSFHLSLPIGKMSTLTKIWGAAALQTPGFYWPDAYRKVNSIEILQFYTNIHPRKLMYSICCIHEKRI